MMTLTINIERYLGILHSMFHRNQVTRNRLLTYVFFSWILWMVIFCFAFVDLRTFKIIGAAIIAFFSCNWGTHIRKGGYLIEWRRFHMTTDRQGALPN